MEHTHAPLAANSSSWSPGSACSLGLVPVVYYSLLLGLGLPANILTVIILSRLVARRQKSSYNYLLALAAADILVLVFIVFVDFLLEDFILRAQMPAVPNQVVGVLEFSAIHTSTWITVPLTVDRYIAVCHPLRYHAVSYPARARRVIAGVYAACLLTSVPYYWWPDLWAEGQAGSAAHHALVWAHCVTVYLVPCAVFFALNSAIVRRLRRRSALRLRGCPAGRTTAILLAVTSAFAALWAPRIAVILYRLYGAPVRDRGLAHVVADVANMLALLNTAANFFLYCFISRRFRALAAATLRALFTCRQQPAQFPAAHNVSVTSSPWVSPANSHCIKMLVYPYDRDGQPAAAAP
ncbi:probable G-protein coupled receptor 139 [Eptesicus fuscus]|uniref:probable G-protein coupled receptor 139 n=1 Tax=Eptesicus fuscus TaxID=29078 RepID=UPI002403C762|nr:probable G-protein coupled receptor 139 [Eptesicus fuscus]